MTSSATSARARPQHAICNWAEAAKEAHSASLPLPFRRGRALADDLAAAGAQKAQPPSQSRAQLRSRSGTTR
jgi:hypothetical protein